MDYSPYEDELRTLRRHFHQWPELSLKERETSAYVERHLRDLGLEVRRVGEYGLTAMIWAPEPGEDEPGGMERRTVLVRAEMDGIAVPDLTDRPWRSRHDGVSHACGHDGNIATLLVFARVCVEHRDELRVNVKLMFQQAEENGEGTALMLDAGVMRDPKVDWFVMIHYVNDAPDGMELHRGASSAAIGRMRLTVHGRSAHWGASGMGVDAIVAAARVVEAVHGVNGSYESVGGSPFIAGIGTVSGGTARNVIADEVTLEGTLRACRLDDYHRLRELLAGRCAAAVRGTGASVDVDIDDDPAPPIISDGELVDLGLEVGRTIWGSDCRLSDVEYLSGDSAARYFDYARGIFFVFTAGIPGEQAHSLHNGAFDFDDSMMWKAVACLHRFVLALGDVRR
ncbi:amidohydrolase [Bifidobacterium sp. MA2]|uniref:Amidohydrolase n=1 Tax=Bifidobacterium santillanense TaxID=2809028 RepID=A0ABS5USI0_9BIFI|nr:amidohydrolase [Bifidobacterium santillanense]MBT1173852.1 amidohydrolase [Bifidobacterium santillanense]